MFWFFTFNTRLNKNPFPLSTCAVGNLFQAYTLVTANITEYLENGRWLTGNNQLKEIKVFTNLLFRRSKKLHFNLLSKTRVLIKLSSFAFTKA